MFHLPGLPNWVDASPGPGLASCLGCRKENQQGKSTVNLSLAHILFAPCSRVPPCRAIVTAWFGLCFRSSRDRSSREKSREREKKEKGSSERRHESTNGKSRSKRSEEREAGEI